MVGWKKYAFGLKCPGLLRHRGSRPCWVCCRWGLACVPPAKAAAQPVQSYSIGSRISRLASSSWRLSMY